MLIGCSVQLGIVLNVKNLLSTCIMLAKLATEIGLMLLKYTI